MGIAWKKIGCLLKPSKDKPWWASIRASGTCAIPRPQSNLFDIYITGVDKKGRSRIGHAIWSPTNPDKLLDIASDPCLDLGDIGTFSESGTSYPSVIKYNGKYYMFFTGWKLGGTVSFYNNLGLAECDKSDGKFIYTSRAPIFPMSDDEPFGIGSCNISYNSKSKNFNLFYTSFRSFIKKNNINHHRYIIKLMKSESLKIWNSHSTNILINKTSYDSKICRPAPFEDNKMLFCQRGIDSRYQIYFASKIKQHWVKSPKPIRLVGKSESWDNNEQCYPFIFSYKDTNFLLYSGNNFGAGGLGIAYQKNGDCN
tara:strand:+ start:926 stop:1858 length:933 start_codon:yes stop_codon:yes gene_type:complete